jgi:hypothetical protein
MEFTENYGGPQSELSMYYKRELDNVKKSLTERESVKVNDMTSRENYIIHNNRVIEYVIVFIQTMNNYKYIDTEDIKQILENLNYIHEHLDEIYMSIGSYINKKLGRTSYDNAVIKLKVAVAYYLLAEYKEADEIFESIDLNDSKESKLIQKIKASVVNNTVYLSYHQNDQIITKSISNIGKNEELRVQEIIPEDKLDKVRRTIKSEINYWYGPYFIADGYQTITNQEEGRRNVFFLNKIQINP